MGAPTKGGLIKDFGRGVELRAPMPDNYPWLLAHLREGDAKEEADAGIPREECPMGILQASLWINGELAACWDSIICAEQTAEAEARVWAFLTTDVVERNKIKFARMSKVVFDYFWKLEHPWVKNALVCTWDGYARCIKWQQKYFGATPFYKTTLNGEGYTFYTLPRPNKEND